jgi:cytochrome oxidase Cu insertion factor (SCO1/SenC/PrrC family)
MSDQPKPRINPTTVWALIVLIAISAVVGWNMLVAIYRPIPLGERLDAFTKSIEDYELESELKDFLNTKKPNAKIDELISAGNLQNDIDGQVDNLKSWLDRQRLPYLSRLEKNLAFTERSGEQVELKTLKGKVIIACWVYTRCPRGCAGVVAGLLDLYKDIGADTNVHFLSASVDPDDKPEQLMKFTENFGIKGNNWWFVTAPKDDLRVYMTRYFGFQGVQDIPEAERLSPDDKFSHDMKVALVDRQGHVRGFYDVASPDPEYAKFWQEKIRKDIKTLLKEAPAP